MLTYSAMKNMQPHRRGVLGVVSRDELRLRLGGRRGGGWFRERGDEEHDEPHELRETFQRGMKPSQVPVCATTMSVSRSEPAVRITRRLAVVIASS
jgi:hypothetical protein